MVKMPKTAKELIEDGKLYQESVIALHELVVRFNSKLKDGIKNKKVDPKDLLKILRGGFFNRPDRWIKNVAKLNNDIPKKAKELSNNITSTDPWYAEKKRAITVINNYLSRENDNMKVYVGSILADLPVRLGRGNFGKFLEIDAPGKHLSEKVWQNFINNVATLLKQITALVAISQEIKRTIKYLES